MTRIEYAMTKVKKWTRSDIINYFCPDDFHCGPKLEERTAIDDSGHIIGCRGKLCGECWAEEVEDGLGI
ncbi:TPA_asm: hypothetical protein vir526_00024 [Caudoviricetes sp. vir526]|nr:TPA_asm: hypothetical protein vir526_00024 [Caudoviricetes sp. vir526]